MLHPLRSHIIYLENTIQSLRDRQTSSDLTIEEIEDIELQLSLSESALDHYRRAYALELKIPGSEPPNHPTGTEGKDGGQGGDMSSVINKKEGLAAAEAGVCRRLNGSNRSNGSKLPVGRTLVENMNAFVPPLNREAWRAAPASRADAKGRTTPLRHDRGTRPIAIR
jgi:hypothetical protein